MSSSQEEMHEGHEFCITVTIQGVGRISGHLEYLEDPNPGAAIVMTVRAWSLSEALRKAQDKRLDEWDGLGE